jgi:CBS-domain-containing membrane protein
MIACNVTHPPAGGNPIIVLVGGYSFEFIITPIITGCVLIIIQAFIINNYILKRKYKI